MGQHSSFHVLNTESLNIQRLYLTLTKLNTLDTCSRKLQSRMFMYDSSKVSSLNRKMRQCLLLINLPGALTKSPHLGSSFPEPFWLWNKLRASCSHYATPTRYPANFLPYPKLKLKLIPSVALIRVGGPVGKWVCQEKSSLMDRLFISKRDNETEVGLLLSLHGF